MFELDETLANVGITGQHVMTDSHLMRVNSTEFQS